MKISDASKSTSTRPIHSASQTAQTQAASPGGPAESVFFRGVPDTELTPRVREALISLIEEVTALRKELAQTHARMKELEELADADALLGVPNRRAFVRELSRALALVERYGAPASLVFADVDNLKAINDSLGHPAGDAALAHVASVISANIRQSDSFGRLGGDEFGVILLQADQTVAMEKARTLAEAVAARPIDWKGASFPAGISYGVVEIRKGWSVEDAIETADTAMYRAKNGAR